MNNPLLTNLNECLNQLVMYKGTLHYIETELNKNRTRVLDSYTDEQISSLFSGHRLAITDLSEFPDDGWRKYYAAPGLFVISGEDYLNYVDAVLERESSWTIFQGYEIFELFLKNTIAIFLLNNKNSIDPDKMQRFISKKGDGYEPKNIDDYKEFLNYSYRDKNNRKLIKLISSISSEFSIILTDNNRSIEIVEWYEMLSEVRHAITHMNFTLKSTTVSNYSEIQKTYLYEFFPVEKTKNGFRLRLNRKHAERIISMLAEYAFTIFKCLSKVGNYEMGIFSE